MEQAASRNEFTLVSEAIRPRFYLKLTDQLIQIRALEHNFETGEKMSSSLEEIGRIAHKIAGIAEFVGHRNLGIAAANLDEKIRRTLDKGSQNDSRASLISEVCAFKDQCEVVLERRNT